MAALAVAITLLGQWLTQDHGRQDTYLTSYGQMVASQLARLSQDAMVREDAIALNVLAEQVSEERAIAGVTVYSLDGTILAEYGESPTDLEFSHPIQLADATAGFVKVAVDPEALNPDSGLLVNPTWLRILAGALLSGLALWALVAWLTRNPGTKPVAAGLTESPETTSQDALLLIAHLFNSNDMQTARSQALMDAATLRISAVAKLYQASFETLSNSTIAVLFDAPDSQDRAFQAACAALVISRLCNQPGGGRYRYSLQRARVPLSQSGSDASLGALQQRDGALQETLDDALLHAALAEDNCIALSADYAHSLPRPERLELTSEHSPVLAALQTSEARNYFLLSTASSATEEMLNRQIEVLRRN